MTNILSCRHSLELSAKQTMATLSFGERLWLRVHLLACGTCRRIRRQVAIIERTLKLAQSGGTWPVQTGRQRLSSTSKLRMQAAVQAAIRND